MGVAARMCVCRSRAPSVDANLTRTLMRARTPTGRHIRHMPWQCGLGYFAGKRLNSCVAQLKSAASPRGHPYLARVPWRRTKACGRTASLRSLRMLKNIQWINNDTERVPKNNKGLKEGSVRFMCDILGRFKHFAPTWETANVENVMKY